MTTCNDCEFYHAQTENEGECRKSHTERGSYPDQPNGWPRVVAVEGGDCGDYSPDR